MDVWVLSLWGDWNKQDKFDQFNMLKCSCNYKYSNQYFINFISIKFNRLKKNDFFI